ncbi:S-DNA-T family DNA segregation ATPase FtsK/SpoIIIE [Pacificibacter maritimus]|uniref:DNA translocase FtsK n=1 Tax=Pacificibacter maritimus TaxID=762213 RepID=A0A3N4UIB0_9RHOB|nr:DNA translocase FtsK [Pacificibacter maritimus]RPE64857.1 S-DNA-T family DNA segregation ATPase FtsK/SpoIIIE [Pacificibacter maritimus]
MASYQARGRDPLFDKNTQAILERRGRELVGIGLLLVAVIMTLILGSYLPEDPSWLSATDAPVNNTLGRLGASIASPLMIIVGVASWAIVGIFAAWGLRCVLHYGANRAVSRVVFAPIAVAVMAVYASTYASANVQSYGGLFGDTVLAALIHLMPMSQAFALKFLSFISFFATGALLLCVCGFTREEVKIGLRFMLIGVIGLYSLVLHLMGKAAKGSIVTGQRFAQNQAERRAQKQRQQEEYQSYHEAEQVVAPRVVRADHAYDDQPHVAATQTAHAEKSGLFAKMPTLLKRAQDPDVQSELVEPDLAPDVEFDSGFDDRIRSKISNVVNARARAGSRAIIPGSGRVEPPLSAAQAAVAKYKKGPKPMVFSEPAPVEAAQEVAYAAGYAEDQFAQMADDNTHGYGTDDADTLVYDDPLELDTPEYTAPDAARYQPVQTAAPEPKRVVQHPVRKPAATSKQAQQEAQPALKFDAKEAEYQTPPLSLLESADSVVRYTLSDDALEENARMLENVLDDYGVKGEIVSVRPGPVVTMYELEPAPGLKASRVIGLADDIARSMSALSARVSTVPGRTVIGIELPNENREKVVLREILSARDFGDSNMKLPLALGKDIGGDPIVANLAKMPHLLIAGTTGSGKSVAINTMILSLLYKLTPDECRMIMIDPKMLELSVYDGIPHLLSPVVTDPKKAVVALKWTVAEMEDRYRKMSKMGVRNIDGYNGRVKEALAKGEMFSRTVQTGFDEETGDPIFETEEFQPETIPYIVVVVDEMADLMMVAGKEIEACIQRLAQMARASGIHIIMATQRPSVDVITGTIKANFPTRISFQVSSKIDSRTILGEQGAEQLLGMGDMLYMAGGSKITRVHGPFCSDEEVEKIVSYLKSYGPPSYVGGVVEGPPSDKESSIDAVLGLSTGGNTDTENALYDTAVAIVIKDRKCSTSYIQRKLAIGYNKAARLVEQMEDEGVVSAANHVGKRDILVPEQ